MICGCPEASPATDPRRRGTCLICGRNLPRARDREREVEFLRAAVDLARQIEPYRIEESSFPSRVQRRVDASETVYGNRWTDLAVEEWLREIGEEALDLGGWPVLFAQTLGEREADAEARLLLQEIAAHGALVDALVRKLRERLVATG